MLQRETDGITIRGGIRKSYCILRLWKNVDVDVDVDADVDVAK